MFTKLFVKELSMREELPKDSYLNHVPAVRNLQKQGKLQLTKAVTFLVGENGIGKSTLIEAIAVNLGFNPEGGTVNFNFSTSDTHSELYRYLRVGRGIGHRKDGFFLRAESFYNVASNIDEMDRQPGMGGRIIDSYGGISLHKQSHGESFMSLIANRFGGNGLYILDEPEAALSPSRILELMCYMHELEKKNSQFIISTHSPILMAYPGAEVYNLTEDGIRSVSYRDTEHYQISTRFLNSPETMFRYLFDDFSR